jgi:hypothetical protein
MRTLESLGVENGSRLPPMPTAYQLIGMAERKFWRCVEGDALARKVQ